MQNLIKLAKSSFFDQGSEELSQLRLFGLEHLSLLFATLVGALLIFFFRKKLFNLSYTVKKSICRIAAAVLFINMVIFYGVFILRGVYDWHIHLPLHLCFLTNFAFIYTLIAQKEKLFKIVYFFTWIGPLPAMLMPNTEMRFDRFQTWHFVISHHVMFLLGLFCLCAMGWRVTASDSVKAFLIGNTIFCAVFIFNMLFGTNYIMTGTLPKHIIELMPILKYVNFPIFWLEICGGAGMALSCLPLYILRRNKYAAMPQKLRQLS